MRFRLFSILTLAAAVLAGACKEQSPVPNTPTSIQIVSGANQSGNVASPLDSALVVRVVDGAGRAVSGVPLTWTVVGGGSLSATSTTTDNNGKSQVTWTLAPTAGTQVVTVTSANVGGASVSFVANNGATITGVVTSAGVNTFGATFSRSAARSFALGGTPRANAHRPSSNRIVVGFRDNVLGLAPAASNAYRSMSVARSAMTTLRARAAALSVGRGISNARVSPAMLAARFDVADTTQIEATMTTLRADPTVAWVERDEIVSIHDGIAPRARAVDFIPAADGGSSTNPSRNIVAKLPNDPFLWEQYWSLNMVDLPRAWTITTGSSNVVVASVDMGIRFDHPDIAANLTNDGYSFVSHIGYGSTQVLCGGGTFDTIDGPGYNGPTPDPTDPDDLEYDDAVGCWNHSSLGDHGLWTAGIIGAVGNEGAGVTGVNWNVKIRPIRVLGITGDGTNFDIAQGVLYAAGLPAVGKDSALVQTSRAPIINMSLGGGFASNSLLSAVTAATNAGSLVIASAGNDGLDLPTYPAAFAGVMGVGAVGMDGGLTTYSNAGTYVSVTAPGGDFRLDDNGGGGVLGPGWDFNRKRATYLFGYGTSASAPFVSGVAALMLAKEPTLTGTQIRSRIEQYATRGAGLSRSDVYGWGIVNAYNALTQQSGPTRSTIARLVNANTGAVANTTTVSTSGNFAFTKLQNGSYYLQVGNDESGDATIGSPGRMFSTAGGVGSPLVLNVNNNSQSAAVVLGLPLEVEPNDDIAHANTLTVGSYVVGSITPPDVRDVYSVMLPAAGTYTFETSGLVGSCGLGIELDTFLAVSSQAGALIGTNDNFTSPTGRFCSRVTVNISTPGIYYVTVTGTAANSLASHGRYRLEVRSGT